VTTPEIKTLLEQCLAEQRRWGELGAELRRAERQRDALVHRLMLLGAAREEISLYCEMPEEMVERALVNHARRLEAERELGL
jgi:hypothetical protein